MNTVKNTKLNDNANRDDLTGEPGAHPVGTAIGASSAAAAGAVAGAALGPIGSAVGAIAGAVIGGIAGGYAGKGIAEVLNPTVVDSYWKPIYNTRPYVEQGANYDTYSTAYHLGASSYAKTPTKKFDDVESDLSKNWNSARGKSTLEWTDAREAVRDSYERSDELYKNKLASNN